MKKKIRKDQISEHRGVKPIKGKEDKKMKKTILTITLVTVLMLVAAPNALAEVPDNPLQGDSSSNQDIVVAEAVVSVVGSVIQVDPSTITCDTVADFEDVAGGAAPGTNYDGILVSGGLQLAERFTGQTLSYSGDFDVLSGSPSSPLTLQTGELNDNVNVYDGMVTGLGPLGYPDYDAIGEGSLAILFPYPQSQFKLLIIGVDGGGAAYLNFFKADGSSLGTITIAPANQTYAFSHSLGIREIAGFSIHNTDPAGIAYDNICYEAVIEVDIDIKPGSCPNPFNPKSKGSVPVGIVGTADFDISEIDVSTVRLVTPSGEELEPLHVEVLDSTQPGDYAPDDCYDCFNEEDWYDVDTDGDGVMDAYDGDGYWDLVLNFDTQALAEAIGSGDAGDCIELTIKGTTLNGVPFNGSDSVLLLKSIQ